MIRIALFLFLTIPFISMPADDSKAVEGKSADTLPASRPQDPRVVAVQRRIDELKALEAQLSGGSMLLGFELEKQFDLPPYGADSQTQKLRNEIPQLEEKWLSIRNDRDKSVELMTAHVAKIIASKADADAAPKPHPLAEPDPFRLAIVYFKKHEYQRVIDTLSTIPGPDARFIEGCAYDAMDVVDIAQESYKKALSEGAKDPRLVASSQRANKFVEWRILFGRPEDLTAPLRRVEVADVIQSAVESAREISSRPADTSAGEEK